MDNFLLTLNAEHFHYSPMTTRTKGLFDDQLFQIIIAPQWCYQSKAPPSENVNYVYCTNDELAAPHWTAMLFYNPH